MVQTIKRKPDCSVWRDFHGEYGFWLNLYLWEGFRWRKGIRETRGSKEPKDGKFKEIYGETMSESV